jgi:hypothetical protein
MLAEKIYLELHHYPISVSTEVMEYRLGKASLNKQNNETEKYGERGLV